MEGSFRKKIALKLKDSSLNSSSLPSEVSEDHSTATTTTTTIANSNNTAAAPSSSVGVLGYYSDHL